MTQQHKKQPKRTAQTHIYMTPGMKKQLERCAEKDCRSVNGQILHYLQRCIEQDEGGHDR